MNHAIDRRTLIYGAAGAALLAACGGGQEDKTSKPTATADGPVINQQDAGTVVTPEDLAALVASLDQTLADRDADALIALLGDAYAPEVWTRRIANIDRLPFAPPAFFLAKSHERTTNSSGNAIEFATTLVYAHQLKGCDAQPTGQSHLVTIRKAAPDAPLTITRTGDADSDGPNPAIWDISEVDSLATDDTLLVFRPQEAARAKRYLDQIDSGVRRAKEIITPAEGVDQVFVALGWPGSTKTLFGGIGLPEALGTAHRVAFVDPQALADGTVVAKAAAGNGPLAGCRIVLHDNLFRGGRDVESTALHEAIHSLADKWGGSAPRWVSEGLAEWAQNGRAAGVPRAQVRAEFPAFARRAVKDRFDFYDESTIGANYRCASAIFGSAEDAGGTELVLMLAEAGYRFGQGKSFEKAMGLSFKALLSSTAKWTRS